LGIYGTATDEKITEDGLYPPGSATELALLKKLAGINSRPENWGAFSKRSAHFGLANRNPSRKYF